MSYTQAWPQAPGGIGPFRLFTAPILALFAILFIFIGILVVYRLYVSPLARFPGPRLAACTEWYAAYYDIVSGGGGMFTFQIKKLHDQYGEHVLQV